MKTDETDKDNKKSLKENEVNLNEAEWNFTTNDINKKLFIQNW